MGNKWVTTVSAARGAATGYIGGVQSCQKDLQTLAKSQSYRLECSTCEKVRRKNTKRKQTETHRAAERTRNEKRKEKRKKRKRQTNQERRQKAKTWKENETGAEV